MAVLEFQKPLTALSTDGQQFSTPVKDTCPILPRSRVGSTPKSTPTSPWKETTTATSCQSPAPLADGLCAQSFPHCGGEALLAPSNPPSPTSFLNFSSPWKLKQEKGPSCVCRQVCNGPSSAPLSLSPGRHWCLRAHTGQGQLLARRCSRSALLPPGALQPLCSTSQPWMRTEGCKHSGQQAR